MKISNNAPPDASIIEKTPAKDAAQRMDSKVKTSGATALGTAVDISEQAILMKKSSEQAKAAPDVRTEKVQRLKEAIQQGTYKVDSSKVAESLIQEHLNSDFGKNNL